MSQHAEELDERRMSELAILKMLLVVAERVKTNITLSSDENSIRYAESIVESLEEKLE